MYINTLRLRSYISRVWSGVSSIVYKLDGPMATDRIFLRMTLDDVDWSSIILTEQRRWDSGWLPVVRVCVCVCEWVSPTGSNYTIQSPTNYPKSQQHLDGRNSRPSVSVGRLLLYIQLCVLIHYTPSWSSWRRKHQEHAAAAAAAAAMSSYGCDQESESITCCRFNNTRWSTSKTKVSGNARRAPADHGDSVSRCVTCVVRP